MRVLVATDDFKGSLSSKEASEVIGAALKRLRPEVEVEVCPIADGGGGTLAALVDNLGGEVIEAVVTGPRGEPLTARWGLLEEKRAVIEMAEAAGLVLLAEDERDPRRTTTYGVGELIRAALERGARSFVVCIGGSATNDAGCGAAQALGVRFDSSEGELVAPLCGADLARLQTIDRSTLDPRLNQCRIEVACDVNNPLYGPNGAAYQYGPQKCGPNLDKAAVLRELDAGLRHLAQLCPETSWQLAGAGAAGGFGFGLVSFFGAELRRGVDIVLEVTRFRQRAAAADLVITGEGQWNATSLSGKACLGAAQAAGTVPTIALVGQIDGSPQAALDAGLKGIHAVVRSGVSEQQALENPAAELDRLAVEVLPRYL